MHHLLITTSLSLSFYLISVLVVLILLSLRPLATARKQAVSRFARAFTNLHRVHTAFVSTIQESAVPTPAVSWANTSSSSAASASASSASATTAPEEGVIPASSSSSGFAGGTAGNTVASTVGCTVGGSDGDSVGTTRADIKTAASEKATPSTSTVEKAAEDSQYTDDGEENQTISNTVKTQIREALDLLVSRVEGSGGCSGQIEITDDIGILKSVNSNSLFQTIAGCDGQTLSSLLPVIDALGTVVRTDDPFALSGLGVAMLFRFFSEHIKRHIYRRGLAMYFAMLPKSSQNVEAFSRLLGIAKKRLYTANQELQDNGFLLDSAHTNQPGAGRTSAAESFESEILPQCIAAGLEESEVILRQQERKTKEAAAAFPDKEENSKAGDKKESTVHNSTPGQAATKATCTFSNSYTTARTNGAPVVFQKSTATYKEVLDTFESAKPHIEKAIARLEAMLYSKSVGDTAYLYSIRFLIMSNVQFVTDELERLKHSEDTTPSNADEASNSVMVRQQITDAFRPCLLFRIDLQIRATGKMCVKLLSVMDALDQKMSVYYQIKALKKAFKVKPYQNYFLWQRNKYRSAFDRIAFLTHKFQRDFDASCKQSGSKAGESSEAAAESESGAGANSQEPLRSACISAELTKRHSEETLQSLAEVCRCLTPFTSQHAGASKIQEAHESLLQLTENFREALQLRLPEDAAAACAARASLVEIVRITLRSCLNLKQKNGTPYKAAERISRIILADGFKSSVAKALKDIRIFTPGNTVGSSVTEPECCSAEQNTCPDGTAKPDEMQIPEEQLTSIKQHADEAQATLEALMVRFERFLGMSSGKRGKRSNDVLKDRQAMKDALNFLTAIREKFSVSMDSVWNTRTYTVWNTAVSLVRVLNELGSKWLGMWKDVKNYEAAFNMVRRITASILSDKYQKRINLRFTHLEQAFQAAAAEEGTLSNYIECSNSDDMTDWFSQTASLAPDKRAGLIRKLWDEGKDPTDIKVWIDYILGKEYARNYSDPSEDYHCCKITRRELKNAFCYLSGIEKSDTTLWYIVTKQMGYTNRQCAKLDQVGGSHPLRETQYNFIQSQIEAARLGKTLILSIDTKAFIVLGRLKHDNGRLLCSPVKGVYRVFDHDYPFIMADIYPNGCSFVDASRMNEKAILRPVGVYCPQDGTAYVALVLGKDTAESMANLIQKVIEVKRSTTMPNLENVLIVADGGGANMSNGIQWKNQLLDLSAKIKMPIQVCHLAPGSSKHNPIEHRLWSEVSIHWKGKPLLDIEHVMRYISETTTGGSTLNHVTCWFDNHHYKTNQEKKESGEDVLTREELDEKAKGRITYPFEEGTDMHKWNYVISPTAKIETMVA